MSITSLTQREVNQRKKAMADFVAWKKSVEGQLSLIAPKNLKVAGGCR